MEEPLVKVYDSPDSVNKQYEGGLHTQIHIFKEMIGPLREYGLLWEKLSAMQRAAEYLGYYDLFIKELNQLADVFVTEQEKRNAAELIERTEQSKTRRSQIKRMMEQEPADTKQERLSLLTDIIRLIETMETFIKDGKEVFLCRVFNFINISVLNSLAKGQFEYRMNDILDISHLRFFTLDSINGLFMECGFQIEKLSYTTNGMQKKDYTEILACLSKIPGCTDQDQFLTYQYVSGQHQRGIKGQAKRNSDYRTDSAALGGVLWINGEKCRDSV